MNDLGCTPRGSASLASTSTRTGLVPRIAAASGIVCGTKPASSLGHVDADLATVDTRQAVGSDIVEEVRPGTAGDDRSPERWSVLTLRFALGAMSPPSTSRASGVRRIKGRERSLASGRIDRLPDTGHGRCPGWRPVCRRSAPSRRARSRSGPGSPRCRARRRPGRSASSGR